MKIEQYIEKIEKSEQKVEKLNGTLERHKKALDKLSKKLLDCGFDVSTDTEQMLYDNRDHFKDDARWLYCDYERKQDDITSCIKKIEDANRILQNWKDKLQEEQAKSTFILNNCPQVIIDFLDEWKKNCFSFYIDSYQEYSIKKSELQQEYTIGGINTRNLVFLVFFNEKRPIVNRYYRS